MDPQESMDYVNGKIRNNLGQKEPLEVTPKCPLLSLPPVSPIPIRGCDQSVCSDDSTARTLMGCLLHTYIQLQRKK